MDNVIGFRLRSASAFSEAGYAPCLGQYGQSSYATDEEEDSARGKEHEVRVFACQGKKRSHYCDNRGRRGGEDAEGREDLFDCAEPKDGQYAQHEQRTCNDEPGMGSFSQQKNRFHFTISFHVPVWRTGGLIGS